MFLTKLKSALAVLLVVGLFTGGLLSMASDGAPPTDASRPSMRPAISRPAWPDTLLCGKCGTAA